VTEDVRSAPPRDPCTRTQIVDGLVPSELRKPPARQVSRRHWVAEVVVCGVACLLIGDLTCRPTGPITPPPTNAEPGRWVYLEGAANTRDSGGYVTIDGRRVRRGRASGSGTLSRLSSAGVDSFGKLGITTVLDFRNRLSSLPPFNGDVWSVYRASSVRGHPINCTQGERPSERYIRGVCDHAGSFRRAFELLSHVENYLVLFHCAAGINRTGVMSALRLSPPLGCGQHRRRSLQ
jgi:hypothetical protein